MARPHGTPSPTIRGEGNPQAVLTWPIVRSIRKERAEHGTTYRELAAKHGVSLSAIRHVVYNTQWVSPTYTPPARRTYNR